VITAIPVGQESEGLAFSPDGRRLYVANEVENTISVVDLVQNQVTRRISVQEIGERPRGIAISPDEKWVYRGLEMVGACGLEPQASTCQPITDRKENNLEPIEHALYNCYTGVTGKNHR
jgi:YVTN family beta-propeller protein